MSVAFAKESSRLTAGRAARIGRERITDRPRQTRLDAMRWMTFERQSPEAHRKGLEAVAWIDRSLHSLRVAELDRGRARQERFQCDPHFEPGQGGAQAIVNARPEKIASAVVAIETHLIGIGENVRIAVGGDPHQGEMLARADCAAPDLHLAGCGAAVGDEWSIASENLLNRIGQQSRLASELRLGFGVLREVRHENSKSRRDRALTGGPVAQNADNVVIRQRFSVDVDRHQAGGEVIARLRPGVPADAERFLDIGGELMGKRRACRMVVGQGGLLIVVRPAVKTLPNLGRPAEKRALRLQAERMSERANELEFAVHRQRLNEISRDLPAFRFERLHSLRREIGLQRVPVAGVLGRVYSVWHGAMLRGAAEDFGIGENAGDVAVPEQRPIQELAVRDGTPLAHRIVGQTLIFEDGGIAGIPVGDRSLTHGYSFHGWSNPLCFSCSGEVMTT